MTQTALSPEVNTEALSDNAQRIVALATELFAQHGYHGVSTRQLAAAAGLNIATVHHHVGTKRDLYRLVYRELHLQERALVDAFVAEVENTPMEDARAVREMFTRFVDQLTDTWESHPAWPRLYIRHWLDGAAEGSEQEQRLSLPLYVAIKSVLERAQAAGVVRNEIDAGLFLRSFDWMIYGYLLSGPVDWEAWMGDPHDQKNLRAFKQFLHEYLIRMLGLEDGATNRAQGAGE